MARRLRIEWRRGDKVTARLAMPSRPRTTGVLLAHGAGVGQDSAWMTYMRQALAAHRYPTMTFDYPYIEAGRRRPDQAPKLEECHVAAAVRLGEYTKHVVLAGKSMGGRIGGHVAERVGAAGLGFFGYPFMSISGAVRSLDHLEVDIPKLFVAGTRDPMGPTDRVRRAVGRLPNAEALLIEDGDHSLKVPKRSGRTLEEVLDGVADATAAWLRQL